MTKRVMRLTASPHSIAAGVAAGVFASFTPFMGLHFIIAFLVAYLIAGNFIAAALGTFVGNPLTFPLIWAATYATGRFILSGATHAGAAPAMQEKLAGDAVFDRGLMGAVEHVAGLWDPLLKPMTVGGIPLGILAAIFFYLLTRQLTIGFRHARQRRLAERRSAGAQDQAGAGG